MEEEVAAAAAAVASQRGNSESNTHNVPTPGNECVASRDVGFFGKYYKFESQSLPLVS